MLISASALLLRLDIAFARLLVAKINLNPCKYAPVPNKSILSEFESSPILPIIQETVLVGNNLNAKDTTALPTDLIASLIVSSITLPKEDSEDEIASLNEDILSLILSNTPPEEDSEDELEDNPIKLLILLIIGETILATKETAALNKLTNAEAIPVTNEAAALIKSPIIELSK